MTAGQPFEVTIGQPEQYSTGSATYYTTSLPNASSLPMVPAGQTPPPIGEVKVEEAKRDVKVQSCLLASVGPSALLCYSFAVRTKVELLSRRDLLWPLMKHDPGLVKGPLNLAK